MKNLFIKSILLLCLCSSLNSYSQLLVLKKLDGRTWPAVSVNNLVSLLNFSSDDLKTQLTNLGLIEGLSGGCHYFSSPTQDKNIYAIHRCPDPCIMITWMPDLHSPQLIMGELEKELEPYFIERKSEKVIYRVTVNSEKYLIHLTRENNNEIVRIDKLNTK